MAKTKRSTPKASLVERCIFWEANKPHAPLDREHIWGRWLRRYVRSDVNKHRVLAQSLGAPGALATARVIHRAGDPLLSNLKIVCRNCNNGWMSRIQNNAKPFLIPLIVGHKVTLGENAQRAIAAWCAMATMTGEYLTQDPSSVSISQPERDWLRDHNTPPDNWRIWIGHYTGRKGIWQHFVVPILSAKDVLHVAADRLASPNTQSTTFVIGNLCVYVMSSTGDPAIVSRWNWPFNSRIGINLPQIFPAKESFIVWPPQALTNGEIELVSNAFERVIDAASRSSFLGRRLF